MYLRLRKRRKPTDPPTTTAEGETPSAAAQPAEPSSSDWVESDSSGEQPADGTDIGTPKHPNRGNARESSRGSHR